MAAVVALAAVTDQPLSTAVHEELAAQAAGGTAGAIVSFVGAVRNHDGGRDVTALDYTAHPTAAEVVGQVVADIAARAEGVRAVAVSHRIGALAIGDAALVVAVAADHRQAAFATCALLVDEVKAQLPVWKHQIFADGTDEWVGSA
jgi:molybdopterin synthase catalytic subunit